MVKPIRSVVAVAVLFVATCCPTVRAADDVPSLTETFAWLKRVDGELKKPNYAALTLEQLKTMSDLRLGGHRASDNKHLFVKPSELKHLVALPQLKKLHLGENDGVTDEALVYVGKLSGLTELILWDSPITDAGIKQLAPLKELTSLDLAFATKLTTACLADIIQLPKLELLVLSGTNVDDVSSLSKLSALKELRLGKLMPKGLDSLKQARPALVVKQQN
jgi:hypothetical protein